MKRPIAIVFRAEASHATGMGHIMRCIAIANYFCFKSENHFILRDSPEIEKIKKLLDQKSNHSHILSSSLTEEEEISEINAIAKKTNAKIIITDLCHTDVLKNKFYLTHYHQKLRRTSDLFVISIEDCRLTAFSSHVAILYNAMKKPEEEKEALNDCLILSDARYFICHPKITKANEIKRIIRKKANHILICIGGSDIKNITITIMQALIHFPEPLEIKVVLGAALTEAQLEAIKSIKNSHSQFELVPFSENWSSFLLWTDIVILGEGTVKFDAAITGTPAIMISQFDHNSQPIQAFLAMDIIYYLGNSLALTDEKIISAVKNLLENYSMRVMMSERGKAIFDGNGFNRICNAIIRSYPKIKEVIHAVD